VEVRAELVAHSANAALLEHAVSRLSLEPGVSAVSWSLAAESLNTDADRDNGAIGSGAPAGAQSLLG
jgi:hypothetical protein